MRYPKDDIPLEVNYRPNFPTRSLRVQRTFSIGVITEEISEVCGGMIVSKPKPANRRWTIPGAPAWFP